MVSLIMYSVVSKIYWTFAIGPLVIFLLYNVVKINLRLQRKWCPSKVCLLGKTVIITGVTGGIACETALNLAMRGARIILASKHTKEAEKLKETIITATNNTNIFVKFIDFSSFKTIRNFVDDVVKTEERVDILINAASVVYMDRKTTDDNLEEMMQINYYGQFLLTILLADLLKKSAPSRIVNLSSIAAKYVDLKISELNDVISTYDLYSKSKLCNIYFTMEIADRLKPFGVSCFSVHPGYTKANMYRKVKWYEYEKLLRLNPFQNICYRNAEEAAQTVIYTAVDKNITKFSGSHFNECRVVMSYSSTEDKDVQRELWEVTEKLVKLEESEKLEKTSENKEK